MESFHILIQVVLCVVSVLVGGCPSGAFLYVAVLVCVCGHFPKAHHGDESSANHPIECQQQQYFELVELGKISHLLKQKSFCSSVSFLSNSAAFLLGHGRSDIRLIYQRHVTCTLGDAQIQMFWLQLRSWTNLGTKCTLIFVLNIERQFLSFPLIENYA